MKHDIKADMKAEGESLKKERSEPASEDVKEAKAIVRPKNSPFKLFGKGKKK